MTGGWSAYDYTSFFIYKNDGNIIAYSKKSPKSYLRKKKELKEEQSEIKLSAERKKELKLLETLYFERLFLSDA